MDEYIPVEDLSLLRARDYIRYNEGKKGFIIGRWEKNGVEGFLLGFKPYAKDNDVKWTVAYHKMNNVEKKINNLIRVEYQTLLQRIKELEEKVEEYF